MPDHINIHHPEGRESRMRDEIQIATLRAQIHVMDTHLSAVRGDLEAIFTRIARGEKCELHMPNGDVFIIEGQSRQKKARKEAMAATFGGDANG